MGIFKRKVSNNSIIKEKAVDTAEIKTDDQNNEQNEQNNEKNEEEQYFWVEGYKGTNIDMKCLDFQYELGKVYKIEGMPELCGNGFHFCGILRYVFNYYPTGRYFKVRALIDKKQYELYQRNSRGYRLYDDNYISSIPSQRDYHSNVIVDKWVAKEIEFIEEIPYDDFKQYTDKIPFVNSAADYNEYLKDEDNYVRMRFTEKASKYSIYSPTFIQVVYDSIDYRQCEETLKYMEALSTMDISADMNVYLLLQKCKSI